ncbi:MAG: Uma2 family endonuclease [Leptolyngbyaceae cyanobacterium bins.349]|nr:Uma2 family endonuclease [Leptolyngbyaceae cyanobacterium bins.349]
MLQDLTTDVDWFPDISHLVIEDETPVDNLISEKQMRLLTETLYSNASVIAAEKFLVCANMGVFYALKQPPLVPDVFLSLNVEVPQDWSEKKNRTYLVWEFGKPPDVVIEIVSNREGNELGSKLSQYARMGVGYYAVFDPLQQLGTPPLRTFERRGTDYQEMADFWLAAAGIGMTLWDGEFEGKRDRWLRWCTQAGEIIPTGFERAEQERARAEQERTRAEQERARADRLAEQLRSLGIEPEA